MVLSCNEEQVPRPKSFAISHLTAPLHHSFTLSHVLMCKTFLSFRRCHRCHPSAHPHNTQRITIGRLMLMADVQFIALLFPLSVGCWLLCTDYRQDMGASGVDVFYRASLSSSFSFIQNLKYGSTVRMGYRRPIVSGDHLVLIVPDIQADIADIDAGALYVYLWDTSADLYVYNSTLTSSEATLEAQLGHSGVYMTYDASRILAPHYTANVPTVGVLANVGGLAVYNWVDGSHYSQVDYVMPTDIAAANLMFGKSAYAASSCVSDDGLWLLAGTYGFESNRGIAISYKYNGATYDEMQRIYESDYDSVVRTNSWGFQMACNFNLTVAAISNRAVPFNFYILSRTGDTFSFEQKIAPEGTATSLLGEQSGFVMSPDGYIILVGDYGYNAEEYVVVVLFAFHTSIGVRVFTHHHTNYNNTHTHTPPPLAPHTYFALNAQRVFPRVCMCLPFPFLHTILPPCIQTYFILHFLHFLLLVSCPPAYISICTALIPADTIQSQRPSSPATCTPRIRAPFFSDRAQTEVEHLCTRRMTEATRIRLTLSLRVDVSRRAK
mmetsp:Transcript_18624/g.46963  ORF Transcript_18624/g.46963 Transcript_18624/m.46963 type:complete len:551 (+) Transcript_18624:1438-3090(+)